MTIEELRRARLAAKLEAMGGIGGYAEAKRKAEVIATAPPAPAPRKTKSYKEDLAAFRETYLQPARISHRKAVYVSDETQQRLDFVVRRIGLRGASISGYVERVLREHLDGYKDSIEQWRKL